MSGDPQPSTSLTAPLGGDSSSGHLAHVLQYLINSGQVRILGGNDRRKFMPSQQCPPPVGSNLENLENSEIRYLISKASGELCGKKKGWSIPGLVAKREAGFGQGRGFSNPEICKISQSKLPATHVRLAHYENKAFCAVYSEDGKYLATACQDRYIRIYSTSAKVYKLVSQFRGRDVGWSLLDLVFSPDGKHVAYSSWSNNLHYVQATGDKSTHHALPLCPGERRFCVFNLVFSAGGDEILCGANDGHLYIYDLLSNKRILRVEAHNDDTNAVTFADKASHIIYSGGDDGFCRVWDRRNLNESDPKPVGILAGHMDGVTFIDSKRDARYLISNSKDQSIKLWDIRQFSPEVGQENTRRVVATHKWDYRWQRAPKKLIKRRANMQGDTSVATYRGHSVLQTLIRCRFSPAFTTGQRYIYTGCAFGRVLVYDMLTGEVVESYDGHSTSVRDASWHPYRQEIVSASWDYSVNLWGHFGESRSSSSCSNDLWRVEDSLDLKQDANASTQDVNIPD